MGWGVDLRLGRVVIITYLVRPIYTSFFCDATELPPFMAVRRSASDGAVNRRYTAAAGIPGKVAHPSGKNDASKCWNLRHGRGAKAHSAEGDEEVEPVARRG